MRLFFKKTLKLFVVSFFLFPLSSTAVLKADPYPLVAFLSHHFHEHITELGGYQRQSILDYTKATRGRYSLYKLQGFELYGVNRLWQLLIDKTVLYGEMPVSESQ